MMKNIFIVGASGFGREVFAYAQHCIDAGKDWKVKGFIDDNQNALDGFNYPVKVISKISDYIPSENDECLLALGSPEIKKKIVELLLKKNAKFATLIHPSVIIGTNVNIGEGVVIFPRVVLSSDIQIGNYVYLNSACTIDHDVTIGDYSTLCCACDMTGKVKVGKGVFCSSHVSAAPSSEIEDWACVGINSFVCGKIKAETKVLGNPASVSFRKNWREFTD